MKAVRCSATKKSGEQFKRFAILGSNVCPVHDSETEQDRIWMPKRPAE